MKLAEVSVKRPVFAIMMSAALVTLGIFSYRTLGVDLMPKTDQPRVSVNIALPGASAEEVENQISKPLEELVNTLPEPKKLVVIESADHFFEGRLREMREAVEAWIQDTIR